MTNTNDRYKATQPSINRSHARAMRRQPTPSENTLWLELRAHKLAGFKFRRQHPIDKYIVDFCSPHCRLIIEIDGDAHAGNEESDAIRTNRLVELGYHVIRFTNDDVMRRLGLVLSQIYEACQQATLSQPPPQRGRRVQKWNPALYDTKHAFVAKYGEALVDLLAPKQGEHILDLGCGTGHLTKQIADCGALVVGMDNSPDMVAAAQHAYPSIAFVQADATDFHFEQQFDAVFSNATLHWVKPPQSAVQCIANALKSGGRFVVEFGGHGNVANIARAVQVALCDMTGEDKSHNWFFPSIGEYTSMLEAHDFEVQAAWLFDRPTPLEGEDGMLNWIRMFGGGMLRGVPTDITTRVTALAERTLELTNYKDDQWFADYRRIRVMAVKK